MEVVNAFSAELNSLMDCKPPVSKAKMTSVTKAAIKAVKFYKHVVQGVEKFIQKCKPEFKVPGLYVIDSIVRQSRHQFGADKDVFTMRFSRNFDITFQNLFKCPPEEKSKIVRVLNLWQKNNVFTAEVIQPLLDMANPNHVIHVQQQAAGATAAVADQETTSTVKQQQQQQESSLSGWIGWSGDGNSEETDGDLALKAVTQLLQQTQEASVASLMQPITQSVTESSLLMQLQQLSNALTQQSSANAHYKPTQQEGAVKFNKKLLDFDYSDEEEEEDKKDDDAPHQQMPENSLVVSMAQSLLSNPELLRQLQQMQQTIQQTEVLKSELGLQGHLSKQRLWHADELATQSLAAGFPTQAMDAYQAVQTPKGLAGAIVSAPVAPTTTTTASTTGVSLQPPPPFDLGSFSSIMAASVQPGGIATGTITASAVLSPTMPVMPPPSFLPIPPLEADSPPPESVSTTSVSQAVGSPASAQPSAVADTYTVIDLDESSLQDNDVHGDSDVEAEKPDREADRKSPVKRRERSRSRSRSKKRTSRRSRSKSPKRVRRSTRSRSGSRTRNRHKRERRTRSREREREREKEREREREKEKEKEKEKEREKERKKRGLPPFKKDHLCVCSTTLWLGHVSKLVSEEDLADAFGEFGDIVQIDLIPPRGCAFVLMNRRQDAYRALHKLKNVKMQGKAITMAWAPGKGVKGKIYKDYWDADLGVSYIPYDKIPEDADLDALEEGSMIDEETMSESLLKRQKVLKEAQANGVILVKDNNPAAIGGDAVSSGGDKAKIVVAPPSSSSSVTSATADDKNRVVVDAVAQGIPAAVPAPIIAASMMPPQFGMPSMVAAAQALPLMPINCPPTIMPIMSTVNQPPIMPMMGGMPPPFPILPPTTNAAAPTLVGGEASQSKADKAGDGTPMDESLTESTSAQDGSQTESAPVRPSSLNSPAAASTPSALDTLMSGGSSSLIPLPPGNAPGVVVAANTGAVTTLAVAAPTMSPALNAMPPSHMAAMPMYQQFMPPPPPPHMFRPPGYGMMPPMAMNMGQMPMGGMSMPHGAPMMGNVGPSQQQPPPQPSSSSSSMMNAGNSSMVAANMSIHGVNNVNAIRMNRMPFAPQHQQQQQQQQQLPLQSGLHPGLRPAMQGMVHPMQFNAMDQNRMSFGHQLQQQQQQQLQLHQRHSPDLGTMMRSNASDVDMRGAGRSGTGFGNNSGGGGGGANAPVSRPTMPNNVPFSGVDMQMNARLRSPIPPSPNLSPMVRPQQQQKQDCGPPPSVSRTSANTEALGTSSIVRNLAGGDKPTEVDRQATTIEARLSRLAEMGDLGPLPSSSSSAAAASSSSLRPSPRGLGERDGQMRPPNVLPGEGLMPAGSVIGRFTGPRSDGAGLCLDRLGARPDLNAQAMLRVGPGTPRPGIAFGRFPAPNPNLDGVRPPLFAARFPLGNPIALRSGPAGFLQDDLNDDDASGDYDMRFLRRPNFGAGNVFVDRDDRPFRRGELDNGTLRFDDHFGWKTRQPLPARLQDDFRDHDRDLRWNRDLDERNFHAVERDFHGGRFRGEPSRPDDWRAGPGGLPPPFRDQMAFRSSGDDDRKRWSQSHQQPSSSSSQSVRGREGNNNKERDHRERSRSTPTKEATTPVNKQGFASSSKTATDSSPSVKSEFPKLLASVKVEPKQEPKDETAMAMAPAQMKQEVPDDVGGESKIKSVESVKKEESDPTPTNGVKNESST